MSVDENSYIRDALIGGHFKDITSPDQQDEQMDLSYDIRKSSFLQMNRDSSVKKVS